LRGVGGCDCLSVGGDSKGTPSTLASRISPIVAGLVPKYVGIASDQSVVDFIDVATRVVEELRRTHSDACYYFLFPHEVGATPSVEYLNQKIVQQMLDAMGQVVHSAVHEPQPVPDAAKAQVLLVTVLGRLQKEYGNELLLLQQKPTDATGRQNVCNMTVSLYKNVEDLPKGDASLLLRYLLSNQETGKTVP
jgi:hypothetical protein